MLYKWKWKLFAKKKIIFDDDNEWFLYIIDSFMYALNGFTPANNCYAISTFQIERMAML